MPLHYFSISFYKLFLVILMDSHLLKPNLYLISSLFLESDNKANNERTERILRENKEVISRLRKQNKEHRKVLSKTNTVSLFIYVH